MKRLISLLLVVVFLAFLILTKPSGQEFGEWYANQTLSSGTVMDTLMHSMLVKMASNAEYQDYLVCRIFSYNDQKVLGVALTFWPLDGLAQQAEDFREEYAGWLGEAGLG